MAKTARTWLAALGLVAAMNLWAASTVFAQVKTVGEGDSTVVRVVVESAVDTDADGLSDDVESALGTDLTLADSDGDGMADAWEVWNALEPMDSSDADGDADGDGLSNADEYLLETLPYEADSDGDGYWDSVEFERGADATSSESFPVSDVAFDVNCDQGVNAVDVQLVIIAALGLPAPYPTDVNSAGDVNALDVQLVINAALGL